MEFACYMWSSSGGEQSRDHAEMQMETIGPESTEIEDKYHVIYIILRTHKLSLFSVFMGKMLPFLRVRFSLYTTVVLDQPSQCV